MNLPKSVIRLYFRAIFPSIRSVSEARINTAAADIWTAAAGSGSMSSMSSIGNKYYAKNRKFVRQIHFKQSPSEKGFPFSFDRLSLRPVSPPNRSAIGRCSSLRASLRRGRSP